MVPGSRFSRGGIGGAKGEQHGSKAEEKQNENRYPKADRVDENSAGRKEKKVAKGAIPVPGEKEENGEHNQNSYENAKLFSFQKVGRGCDSATGQKIEKSTKGRGPKKNKSGEITRKVMKKQSCFSSKRWAGALISRKSVEFL